MQLVLLWKAISIQCKIWEFMENLQIKTYVLFMTVIVVSDLLAPRVVLNICYWDFPNNILCGSNVEENAFIDMSRVSLFALYISLTFALARSLALFGGLDSWSMTIWSWTISRGQNLKKVSLALIAFYMSYTVILLYNKLYNTVTHVTLHNLSTRMFTQVCKVSHRFCNSYVRFICFTGLCKLFKQSGLIV